MPTGVVVVELRGEVDLTNEDVIYQALADAVAPASGAADTRLLVCDMTGVSFLGCVGLTALLRAKAVLRHRGIQLRVVARTPAVVMMFDLTNLTATLGLCSSLEEAISPEVTP
jgi:anti-sigma B factor antagonist